MMQWHYLNRGPSTPWQVGPVRFRIEVKGKRYRMTMETRSPFTDNGWQQPEDLRRRWGLLPKSVRHLTGAALMQALVKGNAQILQTKCRLMLSDDLRAYLNLP